MKLFLGDYISIFLHQTDLMLTSRVKEMLAPFNIAPEQNLIMMVLWEKDGLTQNEIADKLEKDKTNIARMIANLEDKGFIRRVACPKDRRSLHVYLTKHGKELGESVIPIAEQFHHLVCYGITHDELTELRRILSKMRQNVK